MDLRIDSIGTGGEGVGRLPDGRTCFVHRTAPGDQVRARIRQDRARWARATLVEVLEPGPDRREPPCPLYADCGGCQLQHLTEGAQLRAKGRIVHDALTRIGGLALPECRLHAAPSGTAYRNRVTFTLRRLGGGRVVAGFRSLSRPRRLVSVGDQCLLPEPAVLSVWRDLRLSWGPGAARLPRGSELRLTLRGTPQGVLLVIRGGRDPGRGIEDLLEDTPGLEGVWWVPEPGSAQLLAGRRHLQDLWQGGDLELGPFGFVQVNRAMGELLERLVVASLSPAMGIHIVDAYCGSGAYGASLVAGGATVTGIELEPEAVRSGRKRGLDGLEIRQGRVEELLADALPADGMVVNPPRSGLDASIPGILTTTGPPRLVYVSCDPATLGRDLSRMRGSYEVKELHVLDMFPQTSHMETVVVLDRVSSA